MHLLPTIIAYRFAARVLLCVVLALVAGSLAAAQEKAPERGFRPGGSYALSDIETISTTSGNMMLKVPLAALPPGRGGLSASLSLLYNSKLYDSFPSSAYINHSYYDVTGLKKSQGGGWRYSYKYELYGEGRYGGVDEMGEISSCASTNYTAKLSLLTPDGGKHELRLTGHTDGDGFQDVWEDGRRACPGGTDATGTMIYYTTDGTFLRLEVEHDSDPNSLNPWTLYLADGGRVTGGNGPQRIYDRNNNFIEIVNGTYGSHEATYLNDQVGRSIIIEYESATDQDSIHVRGVNNELVTTTVAWTNVEVHKAYSREVGTPFNLPATWRSVSQITLPSQADSLTYLFGYNANGSNPTVGWGEISSITLPSGAKTTYSYLQDNQNNISVNLVLQNRPSQKQLVYRPEYDVSSVSNTACSGTCITETTTYGMTYGSMDTYLDTPISSTITGPDGGVTTEYFNKNEDGTLNQNGLVYKSVAPDGTITERYWQTNVPYGTPTFNETFYAKYEFTSITSAGTPTQTAIREYSYDKNGNITRVAAYDWAPYENVPRNGQGRPYALPSGAQPKSVTVNTYYNPTADASDSPTYDSNAFQIAGSPRLHRTLESSEVQTSGGTALSRSEAFYDNTSAAGVVSYTIGNLTQQKSWDSSKGVISRPLGSGNMVSSSNQYDSYGNPTLTTDGNGVQTQRVYGSVGGYTSLYPTEIRAAYGTGVQRYTTMVYDYYTGVVTSATDQDNGVTTTTSYDDLGRPKLVEHADGKPEETRTITVYSDADRRVIVRSDLNTAGDEKLVSIQHYDQLGRIRLSRQLENAAESETNETTGIKVQTRYLVSGSYSYGVSSNPYRADYSFNAGSEATMGWSRSTSDVSGRVIEAQTFSGSSLPAPWGSNSSSTGTVTTAYDAEYTTVTDQASKVRRSMTNGLGQLARVDEPNSSGLGTTTSPNQATSYTYDALSNLTTVSQGSQTRTFAYDSLKRLLSATNPESGKVCYGTVVNQECQSNGYDANGNLLYKTDAREVRTTYGYDALNRVITRSYTDGTPTVTYAYDPNIYYGKGRLGSVSSSVSSYTFAEYDALGRVKAASQTIFGQTNQTYSVGYTYDRAGHVISTTYPSTRTVTYSYDGTGRTNSFAGNLGGTDRDYSTGILYSPLGGTTKEQFGTDTPIYQKLAYNSRGQLAEIRASTSYTGPTDLDWNRGKLVNWYSTGCGGAACNDSDNNGNLRRQDTFIPHNDQVTSSSSWSQEFDYDNLNRLSFMQEAGLRQEYVYDRFGNRTIHQGNTWGGAPMPNFGVDANTNRLTVPAGYTIGYDSAGNVTNDTYTAGQGERTYDGENRMKQAWANGQWQTYSYDGDGRRVKRNINGAETWQVYGIGGELLAEYAANGSPQSPQKEYGYRNGQLLVTAEAGSSLVRTNVALAANGGSATASSELTIAGYDWSASGAINSDRKGTNWGHGGGWADNTSGSFPDTIEIAFNGSKTIDEIDVFTLQDNYSSPAEPTESMTFSTYGLSAYDVQYWNGSTWVTVTGGSISGNNKIWKKINFTAVTTTKIRVVTNAAIDNGYTRITEVEAWGDDVPPTTTNVAAAANGGFATASSELTIAGYDWAASGAINGDRKGTNWGHGGGWADNTSGAFPDTLEIAFSGSKTINEIDVFTLQDNYSSPAEPTESMTFSTYGLSAYDVQYWNGSAWVTVTGGSISGNDKIWKKINFASVTTTKIRVVTNAAIDNGYTRITEVEAWSPAPGGGTSASISWLVTDHLGTPRMILDKTGALANVKRHDYLPFGEELFAGQGGRSVDRGYSGDSVRQKFTSKERDNETGLDYFGARYYSAMQGRFTGVDIAGPNLSNPQSLNKYAYTLNNPLRYIDRNGLYEEDVHLHLTRALAEAAGFSQDQASQIAMSNQMTDETPGMAPGDNLTSFWHVEARSKYHFTTTARRQGLWDDFADAARGGASSETTLGRLGVYLHAQQDSFSHQGYGPVTGHATAGHAPDKTYNNPGKADTMAMSSFERLTTAATVLYDNQKISFMYKPLDTKVLKPLVQSFNRSRSPEEKMKIVNQIQTLARENIQRQAQEAIRKKQEEERRRQAR